MNIYERIEINPKANDGKTGDPGDTNSAYGLDEESSVKTNGLICEAIASLLEDITGCPLSVLPTDTRKPTENLPDGFVDGTANVGANLVKEIGTGSTISIPVMDLFWLSLLIQVFQTYLMLV